MQSSTEQVHAGPTSDSHEPDMHVNNNFVTGFLGVAIALGLAWALTSWSTTMGWHPSVGGVLVGLSGAILGALGSCVERPNAGAILGWAGATNFILGLILFFTLMGRSLG